ncbi:hypothetical protein [Laribacter hongkongensis]|uniref:hypothetical protein n=1 Tax=Laribacter hongkongensis TaxID=168471 RepID=UPI001EFD3D1C|nr:hypothetical protein [Laribacter hongkongensis]MCG9079177.1 hypothetical protein [Laribacter hongkongensis]
MSRDFLWGKGMTKPAKLPVTGQVTGKAVVEKINEVIEQSLGKDETAVDSERLAGKTPADLMSTFTAESTETANTLVSAHEAKPDPHPQYATDTELSALSQSLSGSVQSAISIAQSKVATVNGVGPDAGGNVAINLPSYSKATWIYKTTTAGNVRLDVAGNWGHGAYLIYGGGTSSNYYVLFTLTKGSLMINPPSGGSFATGNMLNWGGPYEVYKLE